MHLLNEMKTLICLPRHVAHLCRSCAVWFKNLVVFDAREDAGRATSTTREKSTSTNEDVQISQSGQFEELIYADKCED
jgi:hypothetical protein